ncbi:MAG: hypothetical protein ACOVNR_06300, partial [Chitinophagaceae bacterium]
TNKQFQINLNGLKKAKYHVNIVNNIGQTVFQKTLQHEGGTANYTIQFGSLKLSSGNLFVNVIDATDGKATTITQNIIVQ